MTSKVTGGWRPVIDLSHLNRFVRLTRFCMETLASVLQSLRPGVWMVSLDLQDAYLQARVHLDSKRFLRFCVGSKVFQFKALCFGLSSVPQVFTQVMAPVSSIVHRFGFWILRCLDDWLALGSSFQEISRARDFLLWLCGQLGILVNHARSTLTLSQRIDYLGMALQSSPLRAFPTSSCPESARARHRVRVLSEAAARSLALSSWGHVLSLHDCPRLQAPHAVTPTPPPDCGSSSLGGRADFLGRLLPPGSSVVVRSRSSGVRDSCRPSSSRPDLVYGRLGLRFGCLSRLQTPVRLVVSELSSLFHQPPRTSGDLLSCRLVPSASTPSVSCSIHRQLHRLVVSAEGGGDAFGHSQRCGPGDSSPMRGPFYPPSTPVHPGQIGCPCRLSQLELSSPRLRMDVVQGVVSGALSSVGGDSRSLCHFSQQSASGVLLTGGGSSGCGHRCHGPALGSPTGVRFPNVWPHSMSSGQGSPLPRSGDDSGGSVLAAEAMVPGSAGVAGGGSGASVVSAGSPAEPHFYHSHMNLPALRLTSFHIASDLHGILDSLHEWLASLPGADVCLPESTTNPSG